jgi:hypothetical protein
MPLGYGVLLVKEGSALREAMSRPGPSPYLSNIYHITNYCDLSMELSRPNRGLPVSTSNTFRVVGFSLTEQFF